MAKFGKSAAIKTGTCCGNQKFVNLVVLSPQGPPPEPSFMLQENNDFLLLETGFKIIL